MILYSFSDPIGFEADTQNVRNPVMKVSMQCI